MQNNLPEVTKYIVTNSTFCLISYSQRNKIFTLVLDKHGKVTTPYKPLRIIRHTCLLHGSTFDATVFQSKQFFGHNRHKLPIMVAYNFGDPCIMFPLFSPHSKQNIWISLNAIVNIQEYDESTIVSFIDGSEHIFPIHLKSFNQQYVRAAVYYKHLILQRKVSL